MAAKKADADTVNLEAARIIAADPEKYGPGMLMWARLVLKRLIPVTGGENK